MENITVSNVIYDSFQEYEGESSLVLFLSGCNFKCPYCYNLPYLDNNSMGAKEAIDKFLRPNHTAVVFLGGEPTIWDKLPDLVKYVKDKGLKTKIYTNGQYPEILHMCVPWLDAVSIDYKSYTNISKYVGVDIDTVTYAKNIFASIIDLSKNGVNIEIRTTKWPGVEYNRISELLNKLWPDIPHIIQDYKKY